jgi:hypothetical protein
MVPATSAGRGRYSEQLLAAVDHALQLSEKDRPRSIAEWRRELTQRGDAAAAPVRPRTLVPPSAAIPASAAARQAGSTLRTTAPRRLRPLTQALLGSGLAIALVTVVLALSGRLAGQFKPATTLEPRVAGPPTALESAVVNPPESSHPPPVVEAQAVHVPLLAGKGPGDTSPAPRLVALETVRAPEPLRKSGPMTGEAPAKSSRTKPSVQPPRLQAAAFAKADVAGARTPGEASSPAVPPAARPAANEPTAAPDPARTGPSIEAPAQVATVLPPSAPTPGPGSSPVRATSPESAAVKSPLELAEQALSRHDFAEAISLLEPLAGGGNARAQFRMGELRLSGEGIAQSDGAALDWYRKAARQGEVEAQVKLAEMFANGRGVPRDPFQAYVWYSLAAQGGAPGAADRAREVSANLQPAERRQADRVVDNREMSIGPAHQ